MRIRCYCSHALLQLEQEISSSKGLRIKRNEYKGVATVSTQGMTCAASSELLADMAHT